MRLTLRTALRLARSRWARGRRIALEAEILKAYSAPLPDPLAGEEPGLGVSPAQVAPGGEWAAGTGTE